MTENQKLATIPNTAVHYIQSAYTGRQYKLYISLPDNYFTTDEPLPVVYVGDGNWLFPSFYQYSLVSVTPIPPLIIVGIGYPVDGFDEILSLRSGDFYPGIPIEESGITYSNAASNAANRGRNRFLSFITEELFPFVDLKYRTNPADRTYFGYSAGGSFGVYVLFNEPDTFQRYVINAPSLGWGDPDCFGQERRYAANHQNLAKKLHLSVGTQDEFAQPTTEFHRILKKRRYPGLQMDLKVFEGETHITGIAPGISWGLRYVFG